MVCALDGIRQGLSGGNVPGKAPAGDFGFAEKSEENVGGEWE